MRVGHVAESLAGTPQSHGQEVQHPFPFLPQHGHLFLRSPCAHGELHSHAVHAAEEGSLHAIVVVPREFLRERRESELCCRLLRRHPDALVWTAPQWTSRAGTVWHGRGWFPLTTDQWSRLRDAHANHIFISEYSATLKKRQRNLVTTLYHVLERDMFGPAHAHRQREDGQHQQ